MPRHIYPFFDDGCGRVRPFLDVKITNPATGQSIEWHCLADTGADSCLFTCDLAEAVGHDLRGRGVCNRINSGIGGVVLSWRHTFRLSLLSPKGDVVLRELPDSQIDCFEPQPARSGRAQPLPEILGTEDFLRYFVITFDYQQQVTIVKW